jgi:hypothetical protein
MFNRTNEYRQADGYLHVLSTEYAKMSNGSSNPCKIKINGTIPEAAKGIIVDKDNYTSFFTSTDQDLIKFANNTIEQEKQLNQSIETAKKTKKNYYIAMAVMVSVFVISVIVSIVAACIEPASSSTAEGTIASSNQATAEGVGNSILAPEVVETMSVCTKVLLGLGCASAVVSVVGFGICATMEGNAEAEVESGVSALTYEEGVLYGVNMEATFRALNKVTVDPIK